MREVMMAELEGIKACIPFDMDTVTTLPRISLEKGDRVAIVCVMGDSVGAVVDLTLKQHTALTGGLSKDLATSNPYYKKAGAATSFTKVTPVAEAANYVLSADFAAQEGVVVFEVLGEELDNEGGYSHVSIAAADSTVVGKILSVLYVLRNVRFLPAYKLDL